jgi:AcrR family transcriptional regulator
MPKASVSKLVPKVPKVPSVPGVPGTSRRAAYSASTKKALVDVAEALFTEQGYVATSLDAIVAGARVTKGALYHHYSGKQALFEAVFELVEEAATRRIQRALRAHKDPWEKSLAGLRAFLDVVQEPQYRRIVVLEAGGWRLDEPMLETFARIFFGAMSSAGESVSTAEDPVAAAERVEAAIGFLLAGVQSLVDGGAELPSAFAVGPSAAD